MKGKLLLCFISVGYLFFFSNILSKERQFTAELKFQPSWQTRAYDEFMNLNGVWYGEEDKVYRIPFVDDEKKDIRISREFFLSSIPPDTLYLYLEGVSWETEIYLNGKLLSIVCCAFKEHIIKIPPNLFQYQWNMLRLVMRKEERMKERWLNEIYLGVYGSVFLLRKSNKLQSIIQTHYVPYSDSVLIFFPFSNRFLYNISEQEFRMHLDGLIASGIQKIYVPYPLPNRLLKILREKKVYLIGSLSRAKYIAIYQIYSNVSLYTYWLNQKGEKSVSYLSYSRVGQQDVINVLPALNKPLLVLMLFSLMVMIWIGKGLNKEVYQGMWNWDFSIRRLESVLKDKQLQNSISVKYFYFIRIIIRTMVISLWINYFRFSNQMDVLNVWHDENILYQYGKEYGEEILGMFGVVVAFMMLLNIIKFSSWGFVEQILGLKEYRNKNLLCELYGEMPYIFFSLVGSIGILFQGSKIWLLLSLICWLLGILRRLMLIIVLYKNEMRLPITSIFLYLCGVEILPWLLLI